MNDNLYTGILITASIAAIILWGAIVYAAIHFILKFW